MEQIFKILTKRDFGDLYANGAKSFLPGFFNPFWPPYRRKLRFILFDWRVTKGAFNRHVTKTDIWSFQGVTRVKSSTF